MEGGWPAQCKGALTYCRCPAHALPAGSPASAPGTAPCTQQAVNTADSMAVQQTGSENWAHPGCWATGRQQQKQAAGSRQRQQQEWRACQR